MEFLGRFCVSLMGFFSGQKETEVMVRVVGLNCSQPFPSGFVKRRAFVPRRVVRMQSLVLDVLRNSGNAQIGYSVVGPDAVDMVDVHPLRGLFSVKMSPSNTVRVIMFSEKGDEHVSGAGLLISANKFSGEFGVPLPIAPIGFWPPCEAAYLWIIIDKIANLVRGKINQVGHR